MNTKTKQASGYVETRFLLYLRGGELDNYIR